MPPLPLIFAVVCSWRAPFWHNLHRALLCHDVHLAGVLLLPVRICFPDWLPDRYYQRRDLCAVHLRPALRRGLYVVVGVGVMPHMDAAQCLTMSLHYALP